MTHLTASFEAEGIRGNCSVQCFTGPNMSADWVAHDLLSIAKSFFNRYWPQGLRNSQLRVIALTDGKQTVYFEGERLVIRSNVDETA